jgi:hypothetical protein
MTNNRLFIQVRGALVQYLPQKMRIDVNVISADPSAQQIVIENMDGVKRWLFG